MVADFMSNHVSLGKITGSLEAVAQLTIKIEIDIDLVIFRTIERPGGSLREAARGLHPAAKKHQFRRLVCPTVARKYFAPGALCAAEHTRDEVFHRIIAIRAPFGRGRRRVGIHAGSLEQDRWIDVTWDVDPDAGDRFPAKLSVTAVNEPGTLAQIAQLIGEADGNIDNVRMVRRAKDFTEILIELEVWDLDHLTQIIAGLKAKAVVSSVERVFG